MQRTLLVLSLVLIFAGCDSDTATTTSQTLRLSLTAVDALTNGFHYEGWAIVSGSPVSTGKFNVDASGNLVDLSGSTISNGDFDAGQDLSSASAVVITIEPAGDTDAIPADTKYLGGDISSLDAALSPAHGSSLGDAFSSATGSYILTTPTDDPAANDLSGIWFLDNSSGSPAVGPTLPTLPAGWKYEGWAVIGGSPVTTGTFTAVDAVDDAAPFPDDNAAPFTLKPLTGDIPNPASAGTVYSLSNNASAFPSGSATIR